MKIDEITVKGFGDSRDILFPDMITTSWMAAEQGSTRYQLSEPCMICRGTIGSITKNKNKRNGDKRCLECKREEPKRNFGTTAKNKAAYRARLRNAIPANGYTQDEEMRLKQIYTLCRQMTKDRGIEYHVDHILPLATGGMHHPDNLQILLWIDNIRKGSKLNHKFNLS